MGNPGNPFLSGDEPRVLDDPVIKEVAEKLKVSTAQVRINYFVLSLTLPSIKSTHMYH